MQHLDGTSETVATTLCLWIAPVWYPISSKSGWLDEISSRSGRLFFSWVTDAPIGSRVAYKSRRINGKRWWPQRSFPLLRIERLGF
jgi:hypothetical protein